MSPKRAAPRNQVPKREPLVAPRLPDEPVVVSDWDEADALGWAELEVRGDFIGVDGLRLDVTRSRFIDVRLTAGKFDGGRFTDVRFEGCDLSGASLMESAFTRVELVRCRLSGAAMGGSRWRDVRLVDCKLDGAHLRSVRGERVELERCVATTLDASGAEITACRMIDCDLGGADFSNAKLPGLRLHGSALDELRGVTSLRGAVIDTAQVTTLALRLFDAVGISIDDVREVQPEPTPPD
jgi:uncharacterized protein YjbI with pentapeptide repeats